MNAENLYEDMKRALKMFGLDFYQMNLVSVTAVPNGVKFSYEQYAFTVYVPND